MSVPTPVAQIARGFAMGAADIVPGVSGGTVALVLGIYERLIRNVHAGASALKSLLTGRIAEFRSSLGAVEWVWLVSLLAGVLTAIAVLSSVIERLLHDQPVRMAALFFGLVLGSLTIAWRLIRRPSRGHAVTAAVVAATLFIVLGLRADTTSHATEMVTHPWWVFLLAGSLAICAMILPGISGSFILVLIGMYAEVLGAVNDRAVVPLLAFAVGAVLGLAVFSTFLNWSLEHHHDTVMAAMVGLMLGSLRVLWPWPGGTGTTTLAAPTGDVLIPVLLGFGGLILVLGVERTAVRRQH